MESSRVPKFGNWEGGGDVPYTQYFDNARKGRTGKMINPNDPQENPEAFSEEASPVPGAPLTTGSDQGAPKSRHSRRPSREDGDQRLPIGSPLRPEPTARKFSLESPNNRYGDRVNPSEVPRRAGRVSGGSGRSVEQSPQHHHHAKSASRSGVSSPSWERRGSSDAYGHSTPGRSRMRPGVRDDDNYDKGSTVPKFGAWDESDPSSADGFSLIFNKVREEKQIGSTNVPVVSNGSNGRARASSSDSVGCCGCFGLGRNHDL